ncbi:hypothetical protein MBLNU230_g5951t2 [Neophaeotheca triangularis]
MASCLVENPRDQEWWVRAIDAKFNGKGQFTAEDWEHLLGDCMAVVDNPIASFADELVDLYPDAKIILTVRDDAGVWHTSIMNTVYRTFERALPHSIRHPGLSPLYHLQRFLTPSTGQSKFLRKLFAMLDYENMPRDGPKMYTMHNDSIRRLAKGRDFLEFNVKEGWEPLCKFLGKPIPDKPFPRINDTANYQSRWPSMRFGIDGLYVTNLCFNAGLLLLVAGVIHRYQGGPGIWWKDTAWPILTGRWLSVVW